MKEEHSFGVTLSRPLSIMSTAPTWAALCVAGRRWSLPCPGIALRHVLGEHVGELVETILGGEHADHGLLEERPALGAELGVPPRVRAVGAHDRKREGLDEPGEVGV